MSQKNMFISGKTKKGIFWILELGEKGQLLEL